MLPPYTAADCFLLPVFRDFLSLLWFVLVGHPPTPPGPRPLLQVLGQSSLEFMETFNRDRAEGSQSWHSLAIFLCPRTCPHLSPMRRETLFPHKDSYALEQVTQRGYAVSMLADFQD